MFINDYHIHSRFSGDSNEDLDKIINKAIQIGLEEIAITDHFEYDVAGMTPEWVIDLDDYTKTILDYQDRYKDKIDIKLGIEVGVQPHTREHLESEIRKHPFDFVLASTHALERYDIGMGHWHKTMDRKEIQEFYFKTVLDNVQKYKEFCVYGHIDFITRYGGPNYRELNFKENLDYIDEIIKTLVAKNKGVEINTSGFRYKEDRFYPCTDFLKRYVEKGGEIITVGSDSHVYKNIGEDFDKVYDFLKSIGVNYICSFDKMQPVFKKIK